MIGGWISEQTIQKKKLMEHIEQIVFLGGTPPQETTTGLTFISGLTLNQR